MRQARYQLNLSGEQLSHLPQDEQREVMEVWFRERYENPDNRHFYDSEDGDYVWIDGGPYDANEVLREEFEGIVPETLIESLADDLSGECSEWGPVETEDDYDHSLLDVVSANTNAFPTLREALETVRGLLGTARDERLVEALDRLLYANVITALETYLSDTFINRVLSDDPVLRKFIETTPEFKKTMIAYSQVFAAAEKASEEAKRYLLDVVWHNLGKVQAMYRSTLGVEFGSRLADVAKAIQTRHDIVHRNGRDRDGKLVVVSADDVKNLIRAVEALAAEIERQVPRPDF